MKVLVTGGAGFIGSHLVSMLQAAGREVLVVDDFSSGSRDNLRNFTGEIVEGSILDAACMERAMQGVEQVYHLAAFTSAAGSVEDPILCGELNVGGFLTVLTAARNAKCKRVVFASSAAVYGNGPASPKVEDLEPSPESPYALTKLDGERYLQILGPLWEMETVAVRFFNVFGPRQSADSGYAAAVPNFCIRALKGDDLEIFGDGEQTRDFVYVEDLVSALCHLGDDSSHTGVFNVGYGESLEINALAKLVVEISDSGSQIVHLDERLGDVRDSLADVQRLQATNWVPGVGFEEGLARTVAYYAGSAV